MNTNRPWHSLPIEDVFRALETDSRGLSDTEAARRLEQHGPNEVSEGTKTNWVGILFHQLTDPLVFILGLAAVVALLAGETIDTLVIAGVIIRTNPFGSRSRSAPSATTRGWFKRRANAAPSGLCVATRPKGHWLSQPTRPGSTSLNSKMSSRASMKSHSAASASLWPPSLRVLAVAFRTIGPGDIDDVKGILNTALAS